nr:retron St85 family effector protein [Xanthomonas hortorum]
MRPFDGFIFLCGGPLADGSSANLSARQYAMTRADREGCIAGHKVMIAEKLTNVLHGDDFLDLLEFEEHIAALCACVLIFVESPGSIAELGSFSVMTHLANRLLVVCEQRLDSSTSPSFIFLGPIASLRRKRSNSVQVFPMFNDTNMQADVTKMDECWDFIEESMIDSIKRPVSATKFQPDNLAHQMLVVAASIDLFAALKLGEIQEIVTRFGIKIEVKQLRKIIKMLEHFNLIKRVGYGSLDFYMPLGARPLLTLRPVITAKNQIFDQLRFKSDIVLSYKEKDARRYKAISAFLKTQQS